MQLLGVGGVAQDDPTSTDVASESRMRQAATSHDNSKVWPWPCHRPGPPSTHTKMPLLPHFICVILPYFKRRTDVRHLIKVYINPGVVPKAICGRPPALCSRLDRAATGTMNVCVRGYGAWAVSGLGLTRRRKLGHALRSFVVWNSTSERGVKVINRCSNYGDYSTEVRGDFRRTLLLLAIGYTEWTVWWKETLTEIGGSLPLFAIDDNMSATVYFDSSDSLYELSSPAPTLYMLSRLGVWLLPYKQILCKCVLSTLCRSDARSCCSMFTRWLTACYWWKPCRRVA